MNEALSVTINGKVVAASTAESVASAVANAHGVALRHSVTGEPRGPVCGMGVCFECRVTIDGIAQKRSCQTPCRPGMRIEMRDAKHSFLSDHSPNAAKAIEQSFYVIVIGAGPGGMVAACTAAKAGRTVAIIDDNPHFGGQIWRHDAHPSASGSATAWLRCLETQSVVRLPQTTIVGRLGSNTLLAESPGGPMALTWQHLILACGARERFVPFPGWTLPGVFGAGGLQALVKSGLRVAGWRIVIAGSGPLLLPVAAYLRKRGASVRLIAEQTPTAKLMRFAAALLWRHPNKIVETLGLGRQTRGIPYRAGCWPIRADGGNQLTSVTLTDGARTWVEPCDALACGFGLVANLELPALLGCAIQNHFVRVDDHQQTSVPNVYAVGELTGIGGVDKAVLEGQIAGSAATDLGKSGASWQAKHARAMRFVALLDDAFSLRDELAHLADANTIICRCEDVRLGTIQRFGNWRDAKLQTRCGMGPCQGRMCGPIVQHRFGWENDSVRPPIFPTSLGNLS